MWTKVYDIVIISLNALSGYDFSKIRELITQPIADLPTQRRVCYAKSSCTKNGWLDNDKVLIESLTSFKRAGADMISPTRHQKLLSY